VRKFQEEIEELGLGTEQVYNADESGLFWRLVPHIPSINVQGSVSLEQTRLYPDSTALKRPKIYFSIKILLLIIIYKSYLIR
jgi:hypothetical protein